eukprot:9529251-Alexandrium_andersonii.AAC.1
MQRLRQPSSGLSRACARVRARAFWLCACTACTPSGLLRVPPRSCCLSAHAPASHSLPSGLLCAGSPSGHLRAPPTEARMSAL